MITKVTINNFKKISSISFDVNSPLVLIGPNNSGKTSILQALTLWDIALRKWSANKVQKAAKGNTGKRIGISINRKDLISLPVPSAKMLWHNLNTHIVTRNGGKPDTKYVFIEIKVEGHDNGSNWMAAFEFYYANDESFYCRPIRMEDADIDGFSVSPEALKTRVAYLQPMSGLASFEDRLTPGSIDRKIGEGKTADVIRNIAYQLLHPERAIDAPPDKEIKDRWANIVNSLRFRFGIQIMPPNFNPDNGLLDMAYLENGIEYDLSNGGRGFQQTLLLLCFLYSNPGKVILMDEPDAHLEVLRQKEIYNLIADTARKLGSQLVMASHSEVVLREAALKDNDIIAILQDSAIKLNDPKVIKHFRKSLTDFGWDKYYLAKLKKHCIYVEGRSDIENLDAFAKILRHPVQGLLQEANIDPVEGNIPGEAFSRFSALKLIEPNLSGICLFDRLNHSVPVDAPMPVLQWKKREIENYFCTITVLTRWAISQENSLFTANYGQIMENCIKELTPPIYLNNPNHAWWNDEKLGDWALDVLWEFSARTHQPLAMRKSNFHELIVFLLPQEVDAEIIEKLDALYEVIKPYSQ
ncbi:MAG: AAA family ATPase [Bacteroidetes bacterium]|nr:AAA family ATPase [Bacteroidota bacterium]